MRSSVPAQIVVIGPNPHRWLNMGSRPKRRPLPSTPRVTSVNIQTVRRRSLPYVLTWDRPRMLSDVVVPKCRLWGRPVLTRSAAHPRW